MASYTPNYNLKKPAGTDVVDIADLNGNMDIIDTQLDSLNSKLTDYVVIADVACENTGSVQPGAIATVFGTITTPEGYKLVDVYPGYTGDDQFCWVNAYKSGTGSSAAAVVRNASSTADSGTPHVKAIFIRT